MQLANCKVLFTENNGCLLVSSSIKRFKIDMLYYVN